MTVEGRILNSLLKPDHPDNDHSSINGITLLLGATIQLTASIARYNAQQATHVDSTEPMTREDT
jgi:hypothetical protein